jgi:hypothetical protein
MLRYSSYNEARVREPDLAAPYGSDNSSAAENQQERLIKIGWITGYVDGEGCFSINLIRQPHRPGRRGYKTGFQVAITKSRAPKLSESSETTRQTPILIGEDIVRAAWRHAG